MHKMKSASLVLASFLALSATAVTFTAGNSEVVIASKPPPVVRFAAAEATNFLSRVLGAPVPIVNEPSEGRASLVLGVNKWSRTAGIDLSGSPRDSFAIKTSGGNVFVAGIDSPWANPAKANVLGYERGTLMGVYAFLEDYAGCRFYFPGEFGEIAPHAERIEVPDVDRTVSPAMPIRTWHFKDGAEWDESLGTDFPVPGKTLHWLRVRAASTRIPCCHGTNNMKLSEKFGETHPEYFALRKNGTRCNEAPKSIVGGHLGHLCYSSGVRDAIVDICVERFAKGAKYVDIFGDEVVVKAQITKVQGISCHADREQLLAWLKEVEPVKVFVNHGEATVVDVFAATVKERLDVDAVAPHSGDTFDLYDGSYVHKAPVKEASKKVLAHRRAVAVYEALRMAGKRLMAVIEQNRGSSNKDIGRFTNQINALCDRYERRDNSDD